MSEVHIFAEPDSSHLLRLEALAPFIERKLDCLPGGPGGVCFSCLSGFESAFEHVARMTGVAFEWGGFNFTRPDALAVVGNLCSVLSSPTNFLTLVNITNPAAPVEYVPAYDLNADFAIAQLTPRAIVEVRDLVYIQNAQDDPPNPLVAQSRVGVYNTTVPTAVTQSGAVDLGIPTSYGANGGCDLILGPGRLLWSLLGGDTTVNPGKLRVIDISVPTAPAVVAGPISIGTFTDRPTKLAYVRGDERLYVMSGTPASPNQKIFVYNVSNPLAPALVDTLLINAIEAQAGLTNFFIRSGLIYMMAGDGTTSPANLVIYTTAGEFKSASRVTVAPSGLLVVGRPA